MYLGIAKQAVNRLTMSRNRTSVSNNFERLKNISVTEILLISCVVSRLGRFILETVGGRALNYIFTTFPFAGLSSSIKVAPLPHLRCPMVVNNND